MFVLCFLLSTSSVLFAQSNQKPNRMTITPCDGTNGTPPGITTEIKFPQQGTNGKFDYSNITIPVCCPTPTTCPKKKVQVCYYGLEANSQYKFDVLNIQNVNYSVYDDWLESDLSLKRAYLANHLILPYTPQSITSDANGNVCIDYCLPTGNGQVYTFIVYPTIATTSWDYLYQGTFDAGGSFTPGLGWVLGSHQIWYNSFSDNVPISHTGNGVTFQGYSPAPGQSCPLDLCNCP